MNHLIASPWTIPLIVLNLWGVFVIVGLGLGLVTLIATGILHIGRRL